MIEGKVVVKPTNWMVPGCPISPNHNLTIALDREPREYPRHSSTATTVDLYGTESIENVQENHDRVMSEYL
ncbi:MAG: hypothetical protein KAY24_17645 [Candidatus Eisenbacteria sp.]|nr:hypothetical protein [Candidatus Eisenbacteria bacterium]